MHSCTLPQLHSYSDSNTSAGADSAAAVAPLAAIPAVAGQLLPAVAVQGQQPQPQGAKLSAADGVTVMTLPQQQQPPAKEHALEAAAGKEAAYDALWQWAFDVSGVVSNIDTYACRPQICHDISLSRSRADNLETWLSCAGALDQGWNDSPQQGPTLPARHCGDPRHPGASNTSLPSLSFTLRHTYSSRSNASSAAACSKQQAASSKGGLQMKCFPLLSIQAGDVIAEVPRKFTIELPDVSDQSSCLLGHCILCSCKHACATKPSQRGGLNTWPEN